MPYTKIRAMGFAPPTGDESGYNDPKEAVSQLKIAFHAAHTHVKKLNDPADVLPVFLAPEWVFRKPQVKLADDKGKPRAANQFFSYGEMGTIVDELLKLTKSQKETLVIPGSILWAIPGKQEVEKPKKKWPWADAEKMVVDIAIAYNTTPVMCGGKLVHFCHKQVWGLDTAVKDGQIFAFEPKQTIEALTDWKERCKTVSDKGKELKPVLANTFDHAGLRFGIEICADHNGPGCVGKGKPVDVHVLISCGMFLRGEAIGARVGGLVLHTDGVNTKGPAMEKTCFGWTKVVSKGKFAPDPKKKAELYTADKKTFLGKHPKLIWVYDDLLELS